MTSIRAPLRLLPIALLGLVATLAPAAAAADEPPSPAARAAAAPAALPAMLTLDAALAIFEQHGFDLMLADTAVEGARGDVRAAGAIHNPNVGGAIGRSFGYGASCPGCSATQWQASVSDEAAISDVIFGKRGLRVEVAKAALEAAKMSRLDAARTLRFAVKQQYASIVLAKESLDYARQARELASETAALIAARYAAGAVGEVDVARTKTALGEAEQLFDAAERDLRLAKIGLSYLLGQRTLVADYDVDSSLLHAGPPKELESASRESLLKTARDARPDLRAQLLQKRRADANVALTKRQVVPDVSLGLTYSQEGTGDSALTPPTLTLGVSMPLPVFYQNQGEIQRANSDALAASIAAQKTEAQIATDVENAFASFTAARKRVDRMERGGLLDAARKAKDLTFIQYQKGAASLLEVLDAQRTFISVSAEYLQDLTDLTNAIFGLEQAVGAEHAR
jgi:cobalt-zinc-cadmium efflux system outer membrane protein